jgi:hypothetical protein
MRFPDRHLFFSSRFLFCVRRVNLRQNVLLAPLFGAFIKEELLVRILLLISALSITFPAPAHESGYLESYLYHAGTTFQGYKEENIWTNFVYVTVGSQELLCSETKCPENCDPQYTCYPKIENVRDLSNDDLYRLMKEQQRKYKEQE